jgi:hypothetical protein
MGVHGHWQEGHAFSSVTGRLLKFVAQNLKSKNTKIKVEAKGEA